MIKHCYAIFDDKAATFSEPFFVTNDEVAKRLFARLASMDDQMIKYHPEDYALWHLSEFDDEEGFTKPEHVQYIVCTGTELKRTLAEGKEKVA